MRNEKCWKRFLRRYLQTQIAVVALRVKRETNAKQLKPNSFKEIQSDRVQLKTVN